MSQLQNEKSPYLLQHVDNPVDWYPWGDEAFAKARRDDRLIFLSIGYSTCHWCHVMAHESFEDDEVAGLLNRDYVSIKVDREERPDIDQVYMEVCQRMTGQGGWPLTIIMTPDAQPFYAATYIPKESRQGRPGMMQLLPWVVQKWREDPGFLTASAQEVIELLQREAGRRSPVPVDASFFVDAEKSLRSSFDPRHGGFSPAPKFPRPHDLTFLARRYRSTGDAGSLAMVERTLLKMRCGGLFDQVGYGFHRYSTDERWLVPHFEKMLYDQAGLVHAYLAAWEVTDDPFYADTAREVVAYLLRDMSSPLGGFYSAEDADSEGEEGKFYLWSEQEIDALLGAEASQFKQAYHVAAAGNYHDEVSGRLTGQNILCLDAEATGDAARARDSFVAQRECLFGVREERVRPHLDDKVITAWNGMALSALAEAGRLLGEEAYLARACAAAEFIVGTLAEGERLLRRYRDGEAAISGFAEDYAFVSLGFLDLYAATFDEVHLRNALCFAGSLRQYFQDEASGRLYDTPSDGEKLLVRPSTSFDGASPSAASITLEVYARLYLLTGDDSWRRSATGLLESLALELSHYPAGCTRLLQSARWLLEPTREVVIVGDKKDDATERMLSSVRGRCLQQTAVLFKPTDRPETVTSIAPYTADMRAGESGPLAYICSGFACHEPVQTPEELEAALRSLPT